MSKIQDALYRYQGDDVQFMIDHPRCLNRNKMGLGKTIEALAVLEKLNTRHNLIVCKKTLIGEWFQQIHDWLGEDCLTPWEGPGDKLDGLDLDGPRFVCVNYNLIGIAKYWQQLRRKWDVIIFDEAHKLKNPKAGWTKNTFLMTPGVPRIYLLTGTPIQNSPADLFPLFRIMNPRDYHNGYAWNNMFCVWTEDEIWMKGLDGKPRPRIIKRIVPGEWNHTEELRFLLGKYSVYHEKSEVMPQLPPKQYRKIPVELDGERRQYIQMQDELFAILDSGERIESPKVIAQMIRLRQICCDPNLLSEAEVKTVTPSGKTLALLDLLEDMDEKVLVFSFFEQYIRMLDRLLTEKKISHVSITGKRKQFENSAAEKIFQNDPNCKVCLGTIGSMGEGWTLTEAKAVVFLDRFWNPSVNEQCEDRAYGRVNKGLEQSESTLIIDLFCQNTVEEHVHAVAERKDVMISEITFNREVVERMRKERALRKA